MKSFLTVSPRVLLLISTALKASRDNLSGILNYVKLHAPWNLQILDRTDSTEILKKIREWGANGMILGMIPERKELLRLDIPVVTMDGDHKQFAKITRRLNHITCDARAIAYAGADYLIGKGFRHFAYIGDELGSLWSIEREKFFCEKLQQLGYTCSVMMPSHSLKGRTEKEWEQSQHRMAAWLRSLPKQTALFVSNDQQARKILALCQLEDIAIPADLAILGCDNDEMLCENTTPPLSSIEPDFHACGYQAAKLLEQLMVKQEKSPVWQFYGVKRIIERESSQFRPVVLDARVSSGLNFIRLNAVSEIGVCDVATHMHVSRRTAELLFRKHLDRTIGQSIQIARTEKMKHLLSDTSQSVTTICGLSGYNSESQAKLVFKSVTGQSMSQYRKSQQSEIRLYTHARYRGDFC